MTKTTLIFLVPGARALQGRQYWQACRDVLLLVTCLAACYSLLGFGWMLPLGFLLVASECYRGFFNLHQKACDNRLQQQSVDTENLDRVIQLFRRPGWWLPVLNWPWLTLGATGFAVALLARSTEVSLAGIVQGLPVAGELVQGMLSPDWSLLPDAVLIYARQTLEVALLGTGLGFLLALPVSFLCAQNLMGGNILARLVYLFCRAVMVIVRALPTFMLGLIFVALVGLGPFPGVLAITLFSFGVMVKLFSETIETIDYGAVEAVKASGGHWLNSVVFAVIPQALPGILAQLLYCMEINVHSATVLGLIGAEGIGLPIHEYLSALAYDSAATFILVTILMTIVIDYSSAFLRKRVL